MLIDINPNIQLPEYKLVLYKLDETPLQELVNIINLEYKAFYIGIDELTFSIPKMRNDLHGRVVPNEIYDLVEGDFLIKVNDEQFFIIANVQEVSSDNGTFKEVHAFSREYELRNKKLVDYEAVSRKLYDPLNSMSEGIELGILNYIFNNITKAWTIGDYDVDVLTKYRSLSFPNSNLLEVFQTLQTTYNCIFKFDTINQTIDIIDFDDAVGQNKGLIISDENFITNLQKTINSDEIKTRLYLYGENNVSIQGVNITGKPYIDNFSFYKNDKYMSTALQAALDDYDAAVQLWQPDLNNKLADKNAINAILENCSNSLNPIIDESSNEIAYAGLIKLNTDLSIKQTTIDVKVEEKSIKQATITNTTDEGLLTQLHNELVIIQDTLDVLENEKTFILENLNNLNMYIASLNASLLTLNNEIETLQSNLVLSNFFTEDLLKELDRYIKVETYNDSAYSEDFIEELLAEGQKMLNRISAPNIQFNIDVVDFLQLIEAQHIWNKFILGDIVNLIHNEINFNYEVRLIGYTHNVDDYKLNLTFSNTNSVDDATLYLRDLLESLSTTAATIDFNKFKWEKANTLENSIAQYVDAKLEESRQNILSAVGQRHLFDDSGLWLYKRNLDGSINDEQIRAINNTIALTDDNWASIKTAITPQGIVAENIYGKLGAFAQLYANQIIVGGAGEGLPQSVIDASNIPADDEVVKKDTLYNYTKITEAGGIEVYDNLGLQRVQLGNYMTGKYGLLLKDSTGNKTILDDQGIMQTWQEGRTDNVQSGFPITLYVYLPATTRIINKAILRFTRDNFRAYSTATSSQTGYSVSSSSGGGTSKTTTYAGEEELTSLSGGSQSLTSGPSGVEVTWGTAYTTNTYNSSEPDHFHAFERVTGHKHKVDIPNHTHRVEIPNHRHSVTVDDHTHSVTIPSHSHGITYGIYENTTLPTNIGVVINGTNRTSALGGGTGFTTDQSNLNITSYLNTGQWNTIQLTSTTLGRLDATVFIQALMNIES